MFKTSPFRKINTCKIFTNLLDSCKTLSLYGKSKALFRIIQEFSIVFRYQRVYHIVFNREKNRPQKGYYNQPQYQTSTAFLYHTLVIHTRLSKDNFPVYSLPCQDLSGSRIVEDTLGL